MLRKALRQATFRCPVHVCKDPYPPEGARLAGYPAPRCNNYWL